MKNLKNLGKTLTKGEQKTINGGQSVPKEEVPCLPNILVWRDNMGPNGGWSWTANPDCRPVDV